MHGYSCKYCEGTVRPRVVDRESLKHKGGFVILEDVKIGVCDKCGRRYYGADILHRVHEIGAGQRRLERTEQVPVGHFRPA